MIKAEVEFYFECFEVKGFTIEIDWDEQEFHIFKDGEFVNAFSFIDDAVEYCLEIKND
jgi:hypothetical protein